MAYCTVNGIPVAEAHVSMPRVGLWVAELLAVGDNPIAGKAALTLGGVPFMGMVRRSVVTQGGCKAMLVGGGDGLSELTTPKGYNDVPLRIPLTDILTAVGEKLSPNADATVTATKLRSWVVMRDTGARQLLALLGHVPGAVWRALPNGSIWVGVETWPVATLAYELVTEDIVNSAVSIHAPQPLLLPGMRFRNRRVASVEHAVSAEKLRTTVWFEHEYE